MATSKDSKKSSASKSWAESWERLSIKDVPFAPELVEKAKEIASAYLLVVGRDEEDGLFYGHCLELPGALGSGETADACVAETFGSAATLVAYMLETGETPPAPASEEVRDVQINIRVTALEKRQFEEAARQRDQDLSEFLRSAAKDAASLSATRDRFEKVTRRIMRDMPTGDRRKPGSHKNRLT